MDTFHKMLLKLHEKSGGRESVDVDFVELTKREGYFPSIDSIVDHFKKEGWATESRPNILRITHWGIAEAKKCATARPDADRAVERETQKLLSEARNLAVLVEEFLADRSDKRLNAIDLKLTELGRIAAEIRKVRS